MYRAVFWMLGAVLIFSLLTGCLRTRTGPPGIEQRLEQLVPGRYEVLDGNVKVLDVLAQLKGRKTALVGDKLDREVQFELPWQKGSATLDVTADELTQLQKRAQVDVENARALVSLLKQQGLQAFAAGVIGESAFVEVFAEPTAPNRLRTLVGIQNALKGKAKPVLTRVYVQMMEAAELHTRFQEVIPFGHWRRGAAWENDQKLISLVFDTNPAVPAQALMRLWEVSAVSKRGAGYEQRAFQQAEAWAKRSLPPAARVSTEPEFRVETVDGASLTVRYQFPYFVTKPGVAPGEPDGYVSGLYNIDRDTFSGWRRQSAL